MVFLTAYNEFAIKAIKYAAFDYLLKPIDEQELIESLIKFRAKDRTLLPNHSQLLFNQLNICQKLRIKTKTGYEFLEVDDILYIEGDGSYSFVFMQNLVKHTVSKTIKDLIEDLPDSLFIRIHKTYLINKRYLKSLNMKDKICTLKHQENIIELPVSSRLVRNLG